MRQSVWILIETWPDGQSLSGFDTKDKALETLELASKDYQGVQWNVVTNGLASELWDYSLIVERVEIR